jgi:GWxTD domain-containing protein
MPDPLGTYRDLGYLVGDAKFATVGSFAFLPGPADSSWAIFALSLPNSALRFRREPPGFLARYKVDVIVGDSVQLIARLEEMEEVRVRSFRETSRRDESVVFQGFLKLLPGDYPVSVEVRDVNSSNGFAAQTDIQVPDFGQRFVSAPLVVYQAAPRASRDSLPSLILNPRATVGLAGRPLVYVESRSDNPPILQVRQADHVVWEDTLPGPGAEGLDLGTFVGPLDVDRLPPGVLTLETRLSEPAFADSAHLVIALMPGWLAADYDEALSYLRYAGTPAELDSLSNASPRERARLLHAFWKKRDSVPETPENEFFEQYFRRIRDANDRFSEPLTRGWLTDRGAVYVTFGPPDEVLRQFGVEARPDDSQVWLYNESLGFELRLVLVDLAGTGSYSLTAESRRAYREAVQRLYP